MNFLFDKHPMLNVLNWQEEANEAGIRNSNAVSLATVDLKGQPQVRMVLIKEITENGLVFYSNSNSKKGNALKDNNLAAICFYWDKIGKQIRVEGSVIEIDDDASNKYFNSRSRSSQIGAWASDQSQPLESRDTLEERFNSFNKKYSNLNVPRPFYWKGYRLSPKKIEFWLERESRLHDRIEYTIDGLSWKHQFLYP
ncbi:pyridoxamine 5'-phosphate oxidase [Alphaproteobacteria bacterium]|nr:pyridoxamine 5'-phosphate oxidase [Alphaproteobacteria bacterium]